MGFQIARFASEQRACSAVGVACGIGGSDDGSAGNHNGVAMFTMNRTEVAILPTLITDRFGNTVRYVYDTVDKWKVLTITSADGAGNPERKLTFTYVNGGRKVQTVSDGTRTWTYGYRAGPFGTEMLHTVTLPDASKWDFSGMGSANDNGMLRMQLQYIAQSDQGGDTECDPQTFGLNSPVVSGFMVHPSGATGHFQLEPTQHGRNNVPKICYADVIATPARAYYPRYYDSYALTKKVLMGPGMPEMHWTTVYSTFNPGWECTACGPFEPHYAYVTNPKGEVTRYTFGNSFGIDEGLIKQVDIGWNSGNNTALRTTVTRYNQSFTELIGISDQKSGDMLMSARHIPVDMRKITQQGVDFTWLVPSNADFDKYRRPVRVTKSSSLGMSRTESTLYHHNTVKWVVGQVEKVTEASTGKVPVQNTYNATASLQSVNKFGRPEVIYTYHADGSLASSKDGRNYTTSYTNYKRGVPRLITYPNSTTESYVVNDIGNITFKTDQNQFTTGFGYDAMGRMASVTPPAGDSVAWGSTSIVFQQIPTTEYDLGPGHWRQTVTVGNGRTINYFDALLRPVYSYKADLGNVAATSSMTRSVFDFNGNPTFVSYPQRDYASLAGGTHHEYDALGRKTITGTESELGVIFSGNNYGNGFKTTTTNGRGFDTVFSYQVFDEPSESAITQVTAPMGVNVSIARDILGMPKSITRAGGGKSLTRSYVYDSMQRPCKTIEPETGATVQDLDLANNVTWRASGLVLPSTTTCDTASVAAAKKISYTYDSLNRLLTTSYGDNSPGITRTYTPDGLPWTVKSNGADWTYGYNRRRLNESESLLYGGTTYALTKTYDVNGNPSTLKYPDNSVVDFAPNALGAATKVGTYASAVTYHPNGAIKGFTYGNGIAHTLTQSMRGLPDRSLDVGVLNDVYTFDKNGNVASIADWHEGISNRGLEYDDLDRLTRTNAPSMWGDAYYTYDALDNLTSSKLTTGGNARTMTHNYPDPATNRLMSLSGTAAFNMAYGYDSQGNITQRGAQAYVFDIGNRMKQATGKATYTYDGWGRRTTTVGSDTVTRIQVYAQDGKLMYAGSTAAGAIKTKYIYLHKHVIAEVGGAGTQYIHTDGLGSPIARTNPLKGLISRTRYEPYGKTAMGAEPTIGFTGHVNDIDTGLTYMQQRYYDPIAGRMMSIDPVTTDANTGGSFNRYAYANNNPYKYIDPDGRHPDHFYGGSVALIGLSPNEQRIWTNGERAAGPQGTAALQGFFAVQGVVETVRTGNVNIAPMLVVVPKTASGKRIGDYTPAQNKATKAANASANGGQMACEKCNRPLESIKSEKGVPTPPTQAQVHHTTPLSEGGNRDTPPKVLCPPCHKDEHKK